MSGAPLAPPFAADSACVTRLAPSPNFGPRRDGKTACLLVLHYTGMPDHDQALAWLRNPESQVSSHYFVFESGETVQLVSEADRAWHAGQAFWKGETDINSRSIGIEIAHVGHDGGLPDFPDGQIDAVIALCGDIAARHGLKPEAVLAHSDVAPARKADPGEGFPWARLHAAGIGHFVAPAPLSDGRFLQEGETGQPVEALQSMLALYGYEVEPSGRFDRKTRLAVTAFQRHFRPERVDGIADTSTVDTLYRLLQGLPALA